MHFKGSCKSSGPVSQLNKVQGSLKCMCLARTIEGVWLFRLWKVNIILLVLCQHQCGLTGLHIKPLIWLDACTDPPVCSGFVSLKMITDNKETRHKPRKPLVFTDVVTYRLSGDYTLQSVDGAIKLFTQFSYFTLCHVFFGSFMTSLVLDTKVQQPGVDPRAKS